MAVHDATSASLYFYAPVRLTAHAPDFILSPEERNSLNERPCSPRAKSLISRCILIPQKIARPIHAFSHSGCILRSIRGFGCSTFVAKPGCSTSRFVLVCFQSYAHRRCVLFFFSQRLWPPRYFSKGWVHFQSMLVLIREELKLF